MLAGCVQVKKIAKKEPNVSVNPDEVVALGAAVQGGVLAGEVHLSCLPFTASSSATTAGLALISGAPLFTHRLAAVLSDCVFCVRN